MKKIIVVLLALAVVSPVMAQELILGGEVKTGLLDTITETQIKPREEKAGPGSKDDAGGGAGRFRLNMEYLNGNLGFKLRINWEDWAQGYPNSWSYAFGYGNFFNDQLTVSIGKLGASPWGTGGPDLWKELENLGTTGGVRFEYKPFYAPGLNVGFVLNGLNSDTDMWPSTNDTTILHYLQESVIGASYTHEYFMVRAALRLDSEVDNMRGGTDEGMEMLYRVEEYAIRNFLPGFRIWALGYYYGIAQEDPTQYVANNWLFFEYSPKWFSTQLRFGLDSVDNRTVFHVRPNFYMKLFDNLLNVGAQFLYAQDYGEGKMFEGSPFYYMEIEPKIQLNFAPNAHMAFAYNWRREYVHLTDDFTKLGLTEPIKQIQWFNLRFAIYY
jgi:hypothetical protein